MTEPVVAFRPIFGVVTGRFLGWWSETDLVWRDERGHAIGYLEAAWGPWAHDEAGDPVNWQAEPQEYTLYRFEEGRVGEVGVAHGLLLSGLPRYGIEWAGRFENTWAGPGRRAVPRPEQLRPRPVPCRPDDRVGIVSGPGLVDPEDCAWRRP